MDSFPVLEPGRGGGREEEGDREEGEIQVLAKVSSGHCEGEASHALS